MTSAYLLLSVLCTTPTVHCSVETTSVEVECIHFSSASDLSSMMVPYGYYIHAIGYRLHSIFSSANFTDLSRR